MAYPGKPLRIIVNFPPGGTADVLARAVSQALTDKWGQPVVVENRAGAGGNIGAQAVATAPTDGYTLLATPPGPLTINQSLYKELGYDPLKFVPVILLASVPNAITARPDLPANSVKDLIAYAWFPIVAPPDTPAAIAQKLNSAIAELLKLPDVQRKFAAQGAEVTGGTPAEMTIFLETERIRWKKVIDTARVTLD